MTTINGPSLNHEPNSSIAKPKLNGKYTTTYYC